jgi:pyruvate kinase
LFLCDSAIPIDSPDLYKDIKKGEPLFLCNGDIELLVTEVKNKVITAKVVHGGLLTSHKGINVPNTNIKKGGMTPKDIKDAKFGIKAGMDYVALSFVQTANDVLRLRHLLGRNSKVKIVSKIERGIALKNIDKIITASDIIMVARGDLGIEIPIEDLPIVQKNLIRHAHWHRKPTILATQVMTSMIKNPHPTRAEISDIANAVFDGSDMIMLSDETAVGDYPLEAIRTLKKVIKRTEDYIYRTNIVQ